MNIGFREVGIVISLLLVGGITVVHFEQINENEKSFPTNCSNTVSVSSSTSSQAMKVAGSDTSETKIYNRKDSETLQEENKAISQLQNCVERTKEDLVAEQRRNGYECGWLSHCNINQGILARGHCAFDLSREYPTLNLYNILGEHPEID